MEIDDLLQALPKMGRETLCKQWQECFRTVAPEGVRKELLVRMLAYRIQEQTYGGLKPKIRRRLDQMSTTVSRSPNANLARTKSGTRLIRSWQGKTHTVTVEESGYQYEGRRYRSLSEIARHITGTQWSGPLFFGLKSRGPKKGAANVS